MQMAEHLKQQQQQQQDLSGRIKNMLPQKGPTTTQILAAVTLLPVGGTLLVLSGITLAGTLVCMALAAPVFLLFSPVLVPAVGVLALAVAGFLTSGVLGLSAVSSLSWIMNYLRGAREDVPEQLERAKRRMAEAAGHAGQRTKELGQTAHEKGHEVGRKG